MAKPSPDVSSSSRDKYNHHKPGRRRYDRAAANNSMIMVRPLLYNQFMTNSIPQPTAISRTTSVQSPLLPQLIMVVYNDSKCTNEYILLLNFNSSIIHYAFI